MAVLRPVGLAVLLALAGHQAARALPEGAQLTSGQASVAVGAPGRMTIEQTSARAGLDWRRFSIGAQEQVLIRQPGRDAVLVNRVTGSDPSQIFGSLQSNGSVWLINPRGIVFGRDSQVDVGSLVASTLVPTGTDAATGRLQFGVGAGGAGALRAEGRIRAPGGQVLLLAPELVHTGSTEAGRIALAAATQVQVDVEGDGLIVFNARNDGSLDARLQQLGTLRADGGSAELRAAGRAGFADTVLNLEGVVQARGIRQQGGQVLIDGGSAGLTRLAGQVDASAAAEGQRGGQVTVQGAAVELLAGARVDASGAAGGGGVRMAAHIGAEPGAAAGASLLAGGDLVLRGSVLAQGLGAGALGGQVDLSGQRVGLFGQALVDVSGAGGGGRIRVGGDLMGGPGLAASQLTVVGPGAQLLASAWTRGDGGQVVLWSDGDTRFDGRIVAAPGADGGQAGFVETSGRRGLGIALGRVEFGARGGGQWLLDPTDILITGTADPSTPATGIDDFTVAGNFTIHPTTLSGSATNIALRATNSVQINSDLTVAGTFTAETNGVGGSISVAANLSTGGDGTVQLRNLNAAGGNITLGAGKTINAGSGTITLDAGGGSVLLNGNLTTTNATANAVSIAAGGDITLAGVALGAAGTLSLDLKNLASEGTQTVAISAGNLSKLGPGRLTLALDNSFSGTTTVGAGTLLLGAAGAGSSAGSVAGAITVGNGATLVVGRSNDLTLAGPISGTGALTKQAAGKLTLTGDNGFSGTTTISAGSLQLGADGAAGAGGTSGTVAGAIVNDAALVVSRSNDFTLSGVVSGTGTLTKQGDGKLTLGGSNTFSGGTTISRGTLQLGADGVAGAGGSTGTVAGDIVNNAALVVSRSNDLALSGVVSGSGTLTKQGDGKLTLDGSNTFSGGTTISRGTLQLGADGVAGAGGTSGTVAGAIVNNAALVVSRSNDVTLSGVISGTGTLTKQGDGKLTLGGSNTFSGGTTISRGTLQLGADGVAGAGGSTGTVAGDIVNNAALVVSRSNDLTLSGVVSGNGSLTQQGSGTLTLTADNSFSGTTTISAGTLQLGADGVGGAGGSTGTVAGPILNNAALVVSRSNDLTLSGVVSGSGTLTKQGDGKLTLDGNNTFSGDTTISRGTLQLGADGVAGAGGSTGTVAGDIVNNAALVVSRSNDFTLSGAISGNGSLTQQGSGTLTLTADNSFSGTTTISAGTLQLGAGGVGGAGGSTGTVAGPIVNDAALVVSRSNALSLAQAISGNGSLTQQGSGTLTLSGNNSYTGTTTLAGGTLALGSATALGNGGTIAFSGGTLQFSGANAQDLSARFSDAANQALRLDTNGQTVTLADALQSAGGTLTKLGPGSLVLTADNSFSGSTTVSAGTLQLGADGVGGAGGSAGTVAGAIVNNAALVVSRSNDLTLAGVISGTGSLTQQGAGKLTLTADNSITGTTTVSAGTLQLGADGAAGAGGTTGTVAGAIVNNAALVVSRSNDFTLSGAISGSGSLTKQGTGTLTLSGNNTFAGTTTLADGTLSLGSAGALGGGGQILFTGGTLQFSAANTADLSARFSDAAGQTVRLDTNGQTVDMARAFLAIDGLEKRGSGTLRLTGDNGYSGSTTVSAGTLQLGADGAGGSTGTVAGTIVNDAALVVSRSNALSLAQAISGNGSLRQQGSGTLTLSGNNSYTGITTLAGGTLALGSANALGNGGTIAFSGGTLQFSGANAQDLSARFSDGPNQALRLDTNGQTVTLADALQSAGGTLTKLGLGSLVLTADNSFSGSTTISAGSLQLGADGVGGAGGSTGTVAGPIVNNAALVVSRSNALTLSGLISGNGSLTQQGSGTLTLSGNNSYTGTTTLAAGTLQLGSAQALGNGGTIVVSGGTLQFSAANTQDLSARFSDAANQALRLDTNGQTVTLADALQSAGGTLTKLGAGTLTLTGSNSYTGGSTLAAGTLQLGSATALGSSGTISFSGGTLQFSAANTQDLSARFSDAPNQQLRLDTNGQTVTLADALQSAGGTLNKLGTGRLVLTADNGFSGSTTVSAGTLQLGADGVGGAGGSTGTVAGAIVNDAALVVSRSNALTLGGAISGSGSLTQQGSGTLTLTADSSFSGTTTISRGTLQLGADGVGGAGGATGAVAGPIVNNAALVVSRSNALTLAGAISGSGSLTQQGSGTLTLGGNNSYTGGSTLAAGMLALGSANALGSSGTIVFSGGTLQFSAANTQDLSARFSDAANQALRLDTNGQTVTLADALQSAGGTLTKLGTGTLVLTGNNGFTGSTTIAQGTLQLGAGGANASTGSVAGAIVNNASLVVDRSNDLMLANAISGGGSLTQQGSGTLTLSGNNSYTGGSTLAAGTLALGSANALGSSGTIAFGGGTLQFSAANTQDLSARFSDAANQALRLDTNGQTVTLADALQSAGGTLTKLGAGTLTLTGSNSYTGGSTLVAGTLQLGSAQALGSSGTIGFSGGTLQFSAANTQDLSARFSDAANQQLRLDTNGQTVTLADALQSAGGTLSKLGAGTLVLGGSNTYTGATTISAGTLQLGADGVGGAGGSTGTVAGPIVNDAALVVRRSNDLTLAGDISGAGSLTQQGSGTLTLSGSNSSTGSTTLAAGTLALGSASALGTAGAILFNGGTLQFSAANAQDLSARFSDAAGQALRLDTNGQTVVLGRALQSVSSLTKLGSGSLVLTADNGFSGTTTIAQGTLQLGAGGANAGTGALAGAIVNEAALVVDRSNALTLAGAISGSGSLTQQGSGTLTLSGSNSSTGTTTLAAGTLALGSASALGSSGTIVFTGGSLQFSAANTADLSARFSDAAGQQIRIDTNGQTVTLADALQSAGGTLTKLGAGTLVLAADNSYTGSTTIAQGTLQLGAGGANAASGTVAGAIVNDAALVVHRSNDLTLTGAISGSGSLTQQGSGTLTLSGSNSFTGGSTLAAGTLQLGSANALGSSGTIAFSGGTLQFSAANTQDLSARFSDAANQALRLDTNGQAVTLADALQSPGGTLTKLGAGTLTLTGSNSYTGGSTLAAGTLQLGSAQALGSSGTISFSGGTLQFSAANTQDLSARFSDAANQALRLDTNGQTVTLADALQSPGGTLTKLGAGTLVLAADNGYTGATTVSQGTLQLGAGGANAASGTVAGAIVNDAALVIHRSNDLTLAGAISGSGSLTQQGSGTLTLSGSNSYTGGSTLAAGTLQLGSATALGSSGTISFSGGTLQFSAANTADLSARFSDAANQQIRIDTNGLAVTLADALQSPGGTLTKLGAGTLVLSGANSYTGGSSLAAGTLQLGSAAALGSSGTISFSGGTLQFSAAGTADLSARFSDAADQAIRIDTNGQTITLADALQSAGGTLTKLGSGTLVLAADNSYTGATTVSQGTLQLGAGGANASTGTVAGAIVNDAALVVDRSNALTLAGAISGSGSLRQQGSGTLTLSGSNSFTGGTTLAAGTLQLGSAQALGSSGTIVFGGGTLQFSAANTADLSARFSDAANQQIRIDTNGQAVTLADALQSAGGTLTKLGSGTLTLGAANVYSGGTTLQGGTLALQGESASAGSGPIAVGSHTLDLQQGASLGTTATLASGGVLRNSSGAAAVGASGVLLLQGDATLQVAGTGTGITVHGSVQESGGPRQLRTEGGTVTFTARNSHSGGTVVGSGTLVVDASLQADASAGTGTLDVGSQRLVLQGGASMANTVRLAGGTLATGAGANANAGAATHTGTLLLDGGGSLLGEAAPLTLQGTISGSGLLSLGGGAVRLAGIDSHTGGAEVLAGTLTLAAPQALGSTGLLTLAAPARLVLESDVQLGALAGDAGSTVALGSRQLRTGGSGASTRFDGQFSGTADAVLVKEGAGSFTLGGASSLAGSTRVEAGTLRWGGPQRLDAGSLLVVDGGTVDLGGFSQQLAGLRLLGGSIVDGTLQSDTAVDLRAGSVSAVLAGTAGLEKTGAGTVTLRAANTLTGTATLAEGTLALAGGDERLADASRLLLAGGTLDLGGQRETVAGLQLSGGSVHNGTLASSSRFDLREGTISAVLAGAEGLAKTGEGTVTLLGANTVQGTASVAAGTLVLGGADDRLAAEARVLVSGGTLALGGQQHRVAGVQLAGGQITQGTLHSQSRFELQAGSVSAVLAGDAGLAKTGDGLVTLSGANTVLGTAQLLAGTLALAGGDNRLAAGSQLAVAGGTLDLGGGTHGVAGVQLSGGLVTGGTLGSASAFDLQAGSIAAALAGSQGLLKSGPGQVLLSGSSPLTGASQVQGGSLVLQGPQRLDAAGSLLVAEGATLQLAGDQALAAVTLRGSLAGSGTLRAPEIRLEGGRVEVPLGVGLLQTQGDARLGADTEAATVQVLAGSLQVAAGRQLQVSDTLAVAPGATLELASDQTVASLSLAGTLAGSGTLTAASYQLQGGSVLAPLGRGALSSQGNSLLDAPAALDSIDVLSGQLGIGAQARLTALPAVQVQAGASWALQSAQQIGRLAGAGSVVLDGVRLATGAGGDSRFDGAIGGSGSLVKQGAGVFTLGGRQQAAGGTEVQAGTLALAVPEVLDDAGQIRVLAGATLRVDAAETVQGLTLAGLLQGSGTLRAAQVQLQGGRTEAALGPGALVSSGASVLAAPAAVGRVQVAEGTLTLAGSGLLTATPQLVLAEGATLQLQGDVVLGSLAGAGQVDLGSATLATGLGADALFAGRIAGSGQLVKQGESVFTLAGSTTHGGATRVEAGTLQLAAAERLSDASALSVAPSARLLLAGDETVADLVLRGTLGGSGRLQAPAVWIDGGSALADLGSGRLESSGSSLLAGRSAAAQVQVRSGTLALAAPERLAAEATLQVDAGATLQLGGDQAVALATLAGTLQGRGTLSAPLVRLQGAQVDANLGGLALDVSGSSRASGLLASRGITLRDGSLTLQAAQRFSGLPALNVAEGARLQLGGDDTLGSLAGAGSVGLGAFTLATGAGGSSSFAGSIDGTGGLVKQGAASSFTLTGSSSYSGPTWVAEGALVLGDGGSRGALQTQAYTVDGVLQLRRADTVVLAVPVAGAGSVEQIGTGPESTLLLQGSNKTWRGPTRLQSGVLATAGDEALPDASAVQVAAGARLRLGGAETIGALSGEGTLEIASRLSAAGALQLQGPVLARDAAANLLLEADGIDLRSAGNRWGAQLSLRSSGPVLLASGSDAAGRLPLTLGDVQLAGGGALTAATLQLAAPLRVSGGSLVLDLDRGEQLLEPDAALLGRLTPANRQLAFSQDLLTQTEAGRITVEAEGQLQVLATRGGSVQLENPANRIEGRGLAVVLGPAGQAWQANLVAGPGGELSLQNRLRLQGTQLDIGGPGIQADVVRIGADGLRTLGDAVIVAKLPYDNLAGATVAQPALTLSLNEPAFDTVGSFGTGDQGIRIDVGSRSFGNRSTLPLDAGFVSVLPAGGARGSTAVFTTGPTGTYSFFYSGAGKQSEIPVFYNGVSAATPQFSGSISSTVAVSEGARRERFDEALRTENVALRLRAGVIAEVGPGVPATQGNGLSGDVRRPEQCRPEGGRLGCGGAGVPSGASGPAGAAPLPSVDPPAAGRRP